LRIFRWKPWTLLGVAVLAWWYYAAPIRLVERIREAAEEPEGPGAPPLFASRIDFDRVNVRLPLDLHGATGGRLNEESFSHLLLYGWLPQQRRRATERALTRARHTQLTAIRYKDLNRFLAIFWDPSQVYQVVLTLRREGPLHRWRVTGVDQLTTCGRDFDCAHVSLEDLPGLRAPSSR
jgi:hypothetical protein